MGPLGLEPTPDSDGTAESAGSYDNSEECRAAPALHFGSAKWLDLSLIDADLLGVVLAWESLCEPIRKAILALVQSFVPSDAHWVLSRVGRAGGTCIRHRL